MRLPNDASWDVCGFVVKSGQAHRHRLSFVRQMSSLQWVLVSPLLVHPPRSNKFSSSYSPKSCPTLTRSPPLPSVRWHLLARAHSHQPFHFLFPFPFRFPFPFHPRAFSIYIAPLRGGSGQPWSGFGLPPPTSHDCHQGRKMITCERHSFSILLWHEKKEEKRREMERGRSGGWETSPLRSFSSCLSSPMFLSKQKLENCVSHRCEAIFFRFLCANWCWWCVRDSAGFPFFLFFPLKCPSAFAPFCET